MFGRTVQKAFRLYHNLMGRNDYSLYLIKEATEAQRNKQVSQPARGRTVNSLHVALTHASQPSPQATAPAWTPAPTLGSSSTDGQPHKTGPTRPSCTVTSSEKSSLAPLAPPDYEALFALMCLIFPSKQNSTLGFFKLQHFLSKRVVDIKRNCIFIRLCALPLPAPPRSGVEHGCNTYLLNGDTCLSPLSSFPSKAPTLCCVGQSRHSVQLQLRGAHFVWNSRSNYRQISIITTHTNQRPSPQMLSPGNRDNLSEILSCLSPHVSLVPRSV